MIKTREPASGIYLHSKNHLKLIQANKYIEQARKLEEEVSEERQQARKLLKAEYSFEVSSRVLKEEDHWDRLPAGTEILTLTATLMNDRIFEDFMHHYGSISMYPEKTKRSLKYYRKHGILFHTGGGWSLLTDEQPCSDKNWNDIKNGNIPKKFKR